MNVNSCSVSENEGVELMIDGSHTVVKLLPPMQATRGNEGEVEFISFPNFLTIIFLSQIAGLWRRFIGEDIHKLLFKGFGHHKNLSA